jgi:hypothetical protein
MSALPAELIRRLSKPESRIEFANENIGRPEFDGQRDPYRTLADVEPKAPELDGDERLLQHGELLRGDGFDDEAVPAPGAVTTDDDDTGATCSASELSRIDWGGSVER